MNDTDKVEINLNDVKETLLLPLWSRAQASKMSYPIISDNKAIDIIEHLEYDFSKFHKNLSHFQILTLAIRTKEFDSILQNFIGRKGKTAIVNIGAGLDTTSYRIKNGNVSWYDVDLPQVIKLRNKLIPNAANVTEIPKSMFDESFLNDIGKHDDILFIVGGVFMYFEEKEVKKFLGMLSEHFKGAEIVFDTISPSNISYVKRMLKKNGLYGAEMKWGTNDAHEMEKWNIGLKLIEQYPFYSRVSKYRRPISTKIKMRLFDSCLFASIVHMKFI